MKIRAQLLLTHGLLVILSIVIVFINVVTYKNMDSDASIINEAGRLRMLSYNMANLSNRVNEHVYTNNYSDLKLRLSSKIIEFEKTLQLLSDSTNGSSAEIEQPQTIAMLEEIKEKWYEVFKPTYLSIVSGESDFSAHEIINNEIDTFAGDINSMVNYYSEYSKGKITRALTLNEGLLLVIIIVTIYSLIFTNKHISKPMEVLLQELKELSLIDNEFSNRLKNIKTDELSQMIHYFNNMMYDQLTNALNRGSGLAKLNRMLMPGNRRNANLSLCFVDINGLKEVNDNLGHKYGDELIVSVAEGIRQEIREDDFIIRMGGDEFLIVLNGIGQEVAEQVWERILNRYKQINGQEGIRYNISASHGIAEYGNSEETDVESLIKIADDKMYAEKKYIKEELKVQIIKA